MTEELTSVVSVASADRFHFSMGDKKLEGTVQKVWCMFQ